MQITPDPDQGAARQHWWAALSVLGVAGVALIALHAMPGRLPWAVFAFDLALAVGGYALTRRMLAGGSDLRSVWADALRWGLPALAVIVAAVLGAGLFLLPPDALAREARLAVWTLTGFSGVVLMEQGGYDLAGRDELLLHAWIVGVAAQLAFGWSVAVSGLRARPRLVGGLALGGALLSMVLDAWLTFGGREPYAFWLAPARAWPFLLGSLLAVAAGDEIDPLAGRRPLAVVGALALPTYLWTWPLLALPRTVLARPLTGPELLLAMLVAIILGTATHLWIERPVRGGLARRRSDPALLALVMALGLAAAWLGRVDGLPGRADRQLNAEAAALDTPRPFQAACNAEEGLLPPAARCTTPGGRPADVVVWGDSHAAHLTPAVRAWAASRGLAVRQATHSGCPPLATGGFAWGSRDCETFNRAALAEWGRAPHAKVIIMGGGWTWALKHGGRPRSPARLAADVEKSVQAVRAAVGPGPRIVLLGTTPDYAFAPARCHAHRRFLGLATDRCDRAEPANTAAARDMDARLARIAAGRAGVTLYRPWPVFCDGGLCRTRGDGDAWYLDRTHLSLAGGLAQTEALAAVLDEAIVAR